MTGEPGWSRETEVASAADLQETAATLGKQLRAGDLLILTGELGAGKTTFTQGLGRGLGVRAGIISPTFVLVRIHPSLVNGPDLVHVDAYRLSSSAEIDDLDLESTMDTAVTVVEWGAGRAEHLADSWLHITLTRHLGGDTAAEPDPAVVVRDQEYDDAEPRLMRVEAFGPRWADVPSGLLV
ncbi:tRNA (adenosine(37)-N6)-threonylcarbamoyltransferase complex ATPase subunit type 1 TsaE [Arthrobacter sp. H5]|uniref:tRNA (adenosine(37)-N6)-threonylcarbamoyltransferase complex ATPase subunit type 1 TsaE n=1 Tax=Arthrobacter sp. H5 TaxID=1267973 RepID=UPI0004849DB8|nr:tRNA (adenosine(37)-N6)-threonylcarbamoyltransferase complex ATPase subunit type 1 TsaE [Arthrobacter sp. H5]